MLPHYTPGAARRRQQIRNEGTLLRAAESLADKVRPFAADALLSHAAQCAGLAGSAESQGRGCVSVQHPNGGGDA